MRRNISTPHSSISIHEHERNDKEKTIERINNERINDKNIKIITPQQTTKIFLIISTIASAISYYSTLERGQKDQWSHAQFYTMVLRTIVSCIFFTVSIFLGLSILRRTRALTSLIIPIATMLTLFIFDHSAHNSTVFFVILTPIMTLSLIWRAYHKILSPKKLVFINVGVISAIFLLLIIRTAFVQNDWSRSLFSKEEKLQNGEKYFCTIDPPTINSLAILPYRTWNFWASTPTCPAPLLRKGYLDEDGLIIVHGCSSKPKLYLLPQIEKWPLADRMTPIVINNTLAKIEKYNYKGPVVVDAETVVLECAGVPVEVYVRCIEKDDTLKRISDFSKKNPPKEERYNIVVINLDSMSRANFRRKFTTVRNFFKDVFNKTDIEIFEFFRYHSLDVTTLPNTVAMYTGINHKSPQFPTISTIWDEFYENGYASAAVDNNCLDWSAHYQKQRLSKVDHLFLSPFCLPEIHPQVESPDENFSGSFSVGRCLGNDFSHKYVLEYMSQFIKQYEDFPKFVVGSLNEGHERTGEVLAYLANDLFNFFNKVDFDSTIVFMVSDHGLHMNSLFDAGVESVIKENALGLLTAIFPDKFLQQHPEVRANLKHNTQSLVTPFDIFETLRHLAVFPEKPKQRESLSRSLLEEISFSRTCEEAKIPDHFCVCNKQL